MKIFYAFLSFVMVVCGANAELIGSGNDKRRYVTEEEKKEAPFNSVVQLGNRATGTFIAPGLILTCDHCISGEGEAISVMLPDKKTVSGKVFRANVNAEHLDSGLVIVGGVQNVPYLDISSDEVVGTPVKLIGYGGLKVMTDEELKIVKKVYRQELEKMVSAKEDYDGLKLMARVEFELVKNYSCDSKRTKDCVKCAKPMCVFNDLENMKYQEGCKVISYQDGQGQIDCTSGMGYSGAAVLRQSDNKIIGIVSNGVLKIGLSDTAKTNIARPFYYYDEVKQLRDYALQNANK